MKTKINVTLDIYIRLHRKEKNCLATGDVRGLLDVYKKQVAWWQLYVNEEPTDSTREILTKYFNATFDPLLASSSETLKEREAIQKYFDEWDPTK